MSRVTWTFVQLQQWVRGAKRPEAQVFWKQGVYVRVLARYRDALGNDAVDVQITKGECSC